jgi:manganese efflux pump family protein
MNFFEILLIAVSMAMDAFAVCLGAGAQTRTSGPRPVFRLVFHFGLFQFLMPVIGWFAGTTIVSYISAYDHWVAFGLLAFVGIRMIRSGIDPNDGEQKKDPSRGLTLVLLSIAVSIDALAIGLSLGLVGVVIWYPAGVIGVVTGLISWLGIFLGNRLGQKFGKRMEIIGGIILILIGLRILLPHLLAQSI